MTEKNLRLKNQLILSQRFRFDKERHPSSTLKLAQAIDVSNDYVETFQPPTFGLRPPFGKNRIPFTNIYPTNETYPVTQVAVPAKFKLGLDQGNLGVGETAKFDNIPTYNKFGTPLESPRGVWLELYMDYLERLNDFHGFGLPSFKRYRYNDTVVEAEDHTGLGDIANPTILITDLPQFKLYGSSWQPTYITQIQVWLDLLASLLNYNGGYRLIPWQLSLFSGAIPGMVTKILDNRKQLPSLYWKDSYDSDLYANAGKWPEDFGYYGKFTRNKFFRCFVNTMTEASYPVPYGLTGGILGQHIHRQQVRSLGSVGGAYLGPESGNIIVIQTVGMRGWWTYSRRVGSVYEVAKRSSFLELTATNADHIAALAEIDVVIEDSFDRVILTQDNFLTVYPASANFEFNIRFIQTNFSGTPVFEDLTFYPLKVIDRNFEITETMSAVEVHNEGTNTIYPSGTSVPSLDNALIGMGGYYNTRSSFGGPAYEGFAHNMIPRTKNASVIYTGGLTIPQRYGMSYASGVFNFEFRYASSRFTVNTDEPKSIELFGFPFKEVAVYVGSMDGYLYTTDSGTTYSPDGFPTQYRLNRKTLFERMQAKIEANECTEILRISVPDIPKILATDGTDENGFTKGCISKYYSNSDIDFSQLFLETGPLVFMCVSYEGWFENFLDGIPDLFTFMSQARPRIVGTFIETTFSEPSGNSPMPVWSINNNDLLNNIARTVFIPPEPFPSLVEWTLQNSILTMTDRVYM